QEARAIRRYGSEIAAVMADASARGRVSYHDKAIDDTRIQGVTSEYVEFSSFEAERGRLIGPTEIETSRPVAVLGWRTADRLFGDALDPLDKTIQLQGTHFRVIGISPKKGTILGQSQDEFVIIPLPQFQRIFGVRRPLSLTIKPRDVGRMAVAMDDAIMALRSARRLKPLQGDNFGIFTSD